MENINKKESVVFSKDSNGDRVSTEKFQTFQKFEAFMNALAVIVAKYGKDVSTNDA